MTVTSRHKITIIVSRPESEWSDEEVNAVSVLLGGVNIVTYPDGEWPEHHHKDDIFIYTEWLNSEFYPMCAFGIAECSIAEWRSSDDKAGLLQVKINDADRKLDEALRDAHGFVPENKR